MVYRRDKRPSFYFEAKLRDGFKQLCTHTHDKKLAQRIEHMWGELADRYRAWDLLEPVIATPKAISALYDAWSEAKQDVEEVRRRSHDRDIEPLVAEWKGVYEKGVESDTATHALTHLRYLFPEGVPRLASTVTADWLTERLAAYPAPRRNTLRKVHSSWSGFFDYLVMPKRLFVASPMLHVDRPHLQRVLVAFYDALTVARIVAWQPDSTRRAFFSLMYGTGADVSPALLVDRADVNVSAKEVRIQGTKSGGRDRIVRVADTHWPTFWAHARTVTASRVFPATWDRWTVSDWHRQTVGIGVKDTHGAIAEKGLELAKRLPLRKARHHFAVRLLEAGTPVRVVSDMLGSDERTVLKHYGPWIVSGEDRARWEKIAAKHESKRREAK